jgi:hypothetical protein
MKRISLFAVCFILTVTATHAQKLPKEYVHAMQGFFKDLRKEEAMPATINVMNTTPDALVTWPVYSKQFQDIYSTSQADTFYRKESVNGAKPDDSPETETRITDSVVLTIADKKEMKSIVSKANHYKWTEQILGPSKMIPPKLVTPTLNMQDGYYEFSFPLFARNYTVCLFYTEHHCGKGCAKGSLNVYKKKKSGWVLVQSNFSWNS